MFMILNLLCHGVLVVLVVDLEVSVLVLAAPVRHDVEWTRVGSGLGTDLILQDVNVEVGGLINHQKLVLICVNQSEVRITWGFN